MAVSHCYHLADLPDGMDKTKLMPVDPYSLQPVDRFSDRADNYLRYRPSYPAEVVGFFEGRLGLRPHHQLADMGAGTGLFARLFLEKGYKVICIEPNEAMRQAGMEGLQYFPGFLSVAEPAEQTGLPDHSIDFITAAQSFHWMEPVATRWEFLRILRPGGHIVLLWNRLQAGTPFLQAYAALKKKHTRPGMQPIILLQTG